MAQKGYAVLYNPLPHSINRQIELPLYYTGLTETATISINGAPFQTHTLDRTYTVKLDLSIPAAGHVWVVIRENSPR